MQTLNFMDWRRALALSLAFATSATLSGPVALDSTSLQFSASGFPNTIAGGWSSQPLNVADYGQIDFFTVEIEQLESSFGGISSLSFDSFVPGNARSLAFCGNQGSCIGDPLLSELAVIELATSVPGAWLFLSRLVDSYGSLVASGSTTVAYASGGGYSTASGQLRVTAWGEGHQVPTPSTLLLVAAAVLALFAGRHRSVLANGPTAS